MSQRAIIENMSDQELKKALFLSQGLFFFLAIVLSIFFFEAFGDWRFYFIFNPKEILLYGIAIAVGLVIIELILFFVLPAHVFDDGGINEKVFRNQSIGSIMLIAGVVAIAEEMLFRGVIQVTFGYVFASSLFAVVHIRYLKKTLLFLLVASTSFLIGYLFMLTENLLVTIAFHFVVDFLLGVFIKYKKRGAN